MWMENANTLYSVAYNDYFFFVKVGLQGVYFITLTTPSYTAMQKCWLNVLDERGGKAILH